MNIEAILIKTNAMKEMLIPKTPRLLQSMDPVYPPKS